ncbi:hypothetical protein [Faecalibacter bovis]|uniref:Uncharacterized protein n=1 Tax=Faecalibacter bovis TaxID=2898187 RepID=A0ABX7XDZ2_9FLAO|nr:hypothetical protein [Faecalibacter bovis]QTV06068.1 hypothetical protein J9309_01585 [Faecalibacter bovis]
MNNPALFFDKSPELAMLKYTNTINSGIVFSTRSGNMKVINLDGTKSDVTTDKMVDYSTWDNLNAISIPLNNYSTEQSGYLRFVFQYGYKDVYAIAVRKIHTSNNPSIFYNHNKFEIQNLGNFLKQFPALHSFSFDSYVYGDATVQAVLAGDLALIPKYIKRVYLSNIDVKNLHSSLVYNLNNIPTNSELESFYFQARTTTAQNLSLNMHGDLKYLPPSLKNFVVRSVLTATNTSVIYSGGKVWNPELNSFRLSKTMTSSSIDLLLNDMASQVTTAIGNKSIGLQGTRTSASDDAVAYLESLGFTVTVATAIS